MDDSSIPAWEDSAPIADAGAPSPAAPQPMASPTPQDASGSVPTWDDSTALGSMYSTPKEQFKAGLEEFGRSVAGPLATGVEQLLGARGADIRGRQEAFEEQHPVLSTGLQVAGLAGGALTGVGEGAVLEGLGNAGVKALGGAGQDLSLLGKVTSAAGKGAIENMAYQAGDEVSRAMTNDPNQTVGSAAIDVGLAGLIGGGIGGAIGSVSPLWQATAGTKVGEIVNDFSNRMKFRTETPDLAEHFGDTLQAAHDSIDQGSKALYEEGGLKEQEIRKLLPNDPSKAFETAGDLHDNARKIIAGLEADKAPQGKINQLTSATDRFETNILKATQSGDPYDMYNAINTYKQETGKLAKFDRSSGAMPTVSEADTLSTIRDLNGKLRTNLEDQGLWGKAGKVQADINGAYSDLQGKKGPLNLIRSKFFNYTDTNGWKIDPAKVETYLNQADSSKSAVKKGIVNDFINGHDAFHDVIDKIHANAGAENPVVRTSTAALKDTTKKLSTGAALADFIYNKGASNVAGHAAGIGTGEMLGHMFGAPGIGALIGDRALAPFFSKVLPALAKPFATMPTNIPGAKAAIDYAMSAVKGDNLLGKSAKAIFKGERIVLPNQLSPSDKSRERLDKQLKAIQQDPNNLANAGGKLHAYMPNHATSVASTASNGANYLNSIRPVDPKASPLDAKAPINKVNKAEYANALNIAHQPLVIMQKIQNGTVTPKDLQHLQALYPSLYPNMVSKLTQHMTDALSKGQIIPYKTRIGLSMIMTQPVDSTLTGASIIAAQPKDSSPQPPAGGGGKAKGSMKTLGNIAKAAATTDQSREQDQRKE